MAERLKLYTDEHVPRAVAAGTTRAEIVYARQSLAMGEVVRGLLLVAEVLDSEGMRGHVEFL